MLYLPIIVSFIKKYYGIFLLLIGFLLGSLLTCNKDEESVKTTIKKNTKIKYVIKNHTDTIVTEPKVVYKYLDKVIRIKNTDTIIKDFKPKDYLWTYEKIDTTKNKKTTIKVTANGWGNLNKLDYVINTKDSTKIVTNTIEKTTEKTIIKYPTSLFLSGGYDTNKNPNVGLDLTIKNKIILGGTVQYNVLNNKPIAGIKIGVKL